MRPLAGGEARTGVRFIHDPRLEAMSMEERISSGAWDFTEEHYQVQKLQDLVKELLGGKAPAKESSKPDPKLVTRIDALEASLKGINEQLVTFLTAKAAPKKS